MGVAIRPRTNRRTTNAVWRFCAHEIRLVRVQLGRRCRFDRSFVRFVRSCLPADPRMCEHMWTVERVCVNGKMGIQSKSSAYVYLACFAFYLAPNPLGMDGGGIGWVCVRVCACVCVCVYASPLALNDRAHFVG